LCCARDNISRAEALAREGELWRAALIRTQEPHMEAYRHEFLGRMGLRMMCERTIMLQQGSMVEQGPSAGIFAAPQAAYTQELLSAMRATA
jgi:hypothetical protein